MQEIQQNFEREAGFVEAEALDEIVDLSSEQNKPGNKINIDARRKIEDLLEEKALKKLLEDDYGFDY